MHVPNGFLSDPVCAASTEASPAALGVGFARARQSDDSRSATLIAGGLIAALAIVGLLAPWASSAPDGLDRMAQDLQFAGLAASSWRWCPSMPFPAPVGRPWPWRWPASPAWSSRSSAAIATAEALWSKCGSTRAATITLRSRTRSNAGRSWLERRRDRTPVDRRSRGFPRPTAPRATKRRTAVVDDRCSRRRKP